MTLTVWIPGAYVGKNRRHDGIIKTKQGDDGSTKQYATKRLTREAAQWLKYAADSICVAALQQHWHAPDGDLQATILHTNGRYDVDAPVPLVLDAIQAGLGFNDRRFTRLIVERVKPDRFGGQGVWVEVSDAER